VLYVRDLEQAMVLLKPLRLELLRRMGQPRSCLQLGELVGETPQKVYYHVKTLEGAGLVDRVGERRVNGINEGLYQARAWSYWLAPELVGRVAGEERARDALSLGYLLSLAEQLQGDLADLASAPAEASVPSMGIEADVVLADPETRSAFLRDVEDAVTTIAEKYSGGGRSSRKSRFTLMVACYPRSARPDRGRSS
jgi:DNA-binding transcriptional ArsR family regulator